MIRPKIIFCFRDIDYDVIRLIFKQSEAKVIENKLADGSIISQKIGRYFYSKEAIIRIYIYIYILCNLKKKSTIRLNSICPRRRSHQRTTMLLPIFFLPFLTSTSALLLDTILKKIIFNPLDLIPALPDIGSLTAGPEDAQLTTVSAATDFFNHKFVLQTNL